MFDGGCDDFEEYADAAESELHSLGWNEQFLNVFAAEFRETRFLREIRLLGFQRPKSGGGRSNDSPNIHPGRGPSAKDLVLLFAIRRSFRSLIWIFSFRKYLLLDCNHIVKEYGHLLNGGQYGVQNLVEACRKARRYAAREDEYRAEHCDRQLKCHRLIKESASMTVRMKYSQSPSY